MELPIYPDLKTFKDNYENYFFINTNKLNVTFYQYLNEYESIYSEKLLLYNNKIERFSGVVTNLKEELGIFRLKLKYNSAESNDEFEDLKRKIRLFAIEDSELKTHVSSIKITVSSCDEILNFIKDLIQKEKINLLRFQSTEPQLFEITEPLTAKQQQKIGLLIRSGIIDFLREKNPGISNNKISGFIELLTTEPMKKSSITSHLVNSKNNPKHPFYLDHSLDEIDLKLKQLGISPQSEQ